MSSYQEWISQPEIQAGILAGLDKLALPEDPPLPSYGICKNLNSMINHPVFGDNAYSFVSEHSNGYEDFEGYGDGPNKWDGENGAFRRNWCRQMAEALRADPSLWLKEA